MNEAVNHHLEKRAQNRFFGYRQHDCFALEIEKRQAGMYSFTLVVQFYNYKIFHLRAKCAAFFDNFKKLKLLVLHCSRILKANFSKKPGKKIFSAMAG